MGTILELTPGSVDFSTAVQTIIAAKKTEDANTALRYQRYMGTTSGVPIYTRRQPSYLEKAQRPDVKVANDFFGEIVDVKTGYLAGVPIQYGYDEPAGKEPGLDENGVRSLSPEEEYIVDFQKRSMIEDLDAETVKMCAICGSSGRLLYIDTDGKESAINLNPWEFAVIQNNSQTDTVAAIRYYDVEEPAEKGKTTKVTLVEFYTKEQVWYLRKSQAKVAGSKVVFDLDASYQVNPKPHMFSEVPIVMFRNNNEKQGDCEKVLDLIDAYNETLSDQTSEHAAFRTAYMIIEGGKIDKDTLANMRTSGAITVPVGGKVSWLTKTVQMDATKDLKEDLKKNICRFAKSVDFTDQNLYGNLTKMSIHMRLFALEAKASVFERKMVGALRSQFRILGTAWRKKTIPDFDPMRMTFKFVRNLPSNLEAEAPVLTALVTAGVPKEIAFAQMSFIKDPKSAVVLAQKEEAERLGLTDLDEHSHDNNTGADAGDASDAE